MLMVQSSTVSICCVLEQDTLYVLLQLTHQANHYQMGHPHEGCLVRAMNSPENISLEIEQFQWCCHWRYLNLYYLPYSFKATIFTYCYVCWGGNITKRDIDRITGIIKKSGSMIQSNEHSDFCVYYKNAIQRKC